MLMLIINFTRPLYDLWIRVSVILHVFCSWRKNKLQVSPHFSHSVFALIKI